MITLNHYLILSAALFVMGFAGVILRRNILILLMSIELMLNAVNLSFVVFSRYWGNLEGQIASFFVIVLAAAEAAIGLAIIVLVFRRRASVQSSGLTQLKDVVHVD
jgi:NADH-quinone oxidoreductase subunit K